MKALVDGPYHYYLPHVDLPALCEVTSGRVWFAGDDNPVPLAKLSGRFVRLVEDVSELAQAWPMLEHVPDGEDRFADTYGPPTGA